MASPRAYRFVRSLVAVAVATAVVGVALPDRRGAPLPDVVPAPQAIESADRTLFPRGPVRLGAGSRVIVRDGALRGVAESLDDALWSLTDVDVGLATTTTRLQARDGDIVVALDPGLAREEYRLEVTGAVEITGGSPSAVSWGVATLLQISSHETGSVLVPRVRVRDAPVYPFRALAVDIASRPHTLGQLQELVEFARFYKINHLQLRLTSDEAVALPTSLLDAGRPWRVYAREDLQALEAFAADRGVTLIPEIGLPGGARALVSADPTLFGLENRLTNPGTVHLAREGVYQAIDAIVGDAAQILRGLRSSTSVGSTQACEASPRIRKPAGSWRRRGWPTWPSFGGTSRPGYREWSRSGDVAPWSGTSRPTAMCRCPPTWAFRPGAWARKC